MAAKRATPIQRIFARLRGRPMMPEPQHEHIIRTELRSLLERDAYVEAIEHIESSPDHLVHLIELLRNRNLELPGIVTISNLAKRGADISKAIETLSIRLLCNDLNMSAYASRALTYYHISHVHLEEVDLLLSSGISSVQYGCAEGLRDACLAQNLLAINFTTTRLFSHSPKVQENAFWALSSAAETGTEEVKGAIAEIVSNHISDIKGSENARLDVYRCLSRIHEVASPRGE